MSDKEIDFRMTKARTALIQRHPFWGTLALYLEFVEDNSQPTMWTDGKRLGYNSKWLDELSEAEIAGVQAHEVSHCAYRHMTREGKREHDLWNSACDYAVNRDLRAAIAASASNAKVMQLPDPHLYDKRFDALSAEEVYEILKQECEDDPAKRPKLVGISSRCGEIRVPGDGSGGELSEAAKADLEVEWDIRLRQAVATEKARHAGNLPDYLKKMFDIANKPVVDWRAKLRNFVDASMRFDYSWRKLNRGLFSMGIMVPGTIPDGVKKLVVILDTSGSVFFREDMMSAFLNELQTLLDESACEVMVFICADWTIKKAQEFVYGDTIKPVIEGGGGTSFAPAIEWAMKHHPDTAAIIYFTDLEVYGDGWGKEPEVPTLWITYGPADEVVPKMASVLYGEVVHMLN